MSTPDIHILAKPLEPEEGIKEQRRVRIRKLSVARSETETEAEKRLWNFTINRGMTMNETLDRKFVPPSPRIFFRKANTRHTQSESRLWKSTASQLLSVEDGLLILFGFISGFAVASCFGQILGLFR